MIEWGADFPAVFRLHQSVLMQAVDPQEDGQTSAPGTGSGIDGLIIRNFRTALSDPCLDLIRQNLPDNH